MLVNRFDELSNPENHLNTFSNKKPQVRPTPSSTFIFDLGGQGVRVGKESNKGLNRPVARRGDYQLSQLDSLLSTLTKRFFTISSHQEILYYQLSKSDSLLSTLTKRFFTINSYKEILYYQLLQRDSLLSTLTKRLFTINSYKEMLYYQFLQRASLLSTQVTRRQGGGRRSKVDRIKSFTNPPSTRSIFLESKSVR